MLSAQGLSKTYDTGVRALDDVSIDIHKGEVFALLGPNGAGKTTFIGIISGLVQKTSGTATIDGHDIGTSWRLARQAIGLVQCRQDQFNGKTIQRMKRAQRIGLIVFTHSHQEGRTASPLRACPVLKSERGRSGQFLGIPIDFEQLKVPDLIAPAFNLSPKIRLRARKFFFRLAGCFAQQVGRSGGCASHVCQ